MFLQTGEKIFEQVPPILEELMASCIAGVAEAVRAENGTGVNARNPL